MTAIATSIATTLGLFLLIALGGCNGRCARHSDCLAGATCSPEGLCTSPLTDARVEDPDAFMFPNMPATDADTDASSDADDASVDAL